MCSAIESVPCWRTSCDCLDGRVNIDSSAPRWNVFLSSSEGMGWAGLVMSSYSVMYRYVRSTAVFAEM